MENLANNTEIAVRLARIEEQLKSLDEKMQDAVLSQLKDHGKRIRDLELNQQRILVYVCGVNIIACAVIAAVIKGWF